MTSNQRRAGSRELWSNFDWRVTFAPGAGLLAAVIALVFFNKPIYVVAGIFAFVTLVLTWKRPDLVLMLILVATPFQRDVSGGDRDSGGSGVAFSIAEFLFATSLPAFLLNSIMARRRLRLGPIAFPVLIYLSICVVSSAVNWRGPSTAIALCQMVLYLVLTVVAYASFPRKAEDLSLSLTGFAYVGTVLGALVTVGGVGIVGLNKNGAGASLCAALLVCTELWFQARSGKARLRFGICLTIIAAGLIVSVSRGAWIGTIAGLMLILAMRGQFRLLLRLGITLAVLVAIAWQFIPEEKKQYAFDFDSKRHSIAARYQSIDFARKCFLENPVIGVGVGLRKQVDATNVLWFTLAETGILGLFAFLLIHVALGHMIFFTRRRVARTDIQFSLLVLGGALVLSKLMHGMVDHYWSRGHLLMAWAAAGMATGVYYRTNSGTPRIAAGVKQPSVESQQIPEAP